MPFIFTTRTSVMLTLLSIIFGIVLQSTTVLATEQDLAQRDSIYNQYVNVGYINSGVDTSNLMPSEDVVNSYGLAIGYGDEISTLLIDFAKSGSPPNTYQANVEDDTNLYNVYLYVDFEKGCINSEATFQKFQQSLTASTGQEVADDLTQYILQQLESGSGAAACVQIYNSEGWMGDGVVAVVDIGSSFDFADAC